MLDLSEITRRAKEAPRQTTDVDVVFDVGLTQRLGELREEQNSLDEQLEQVDAGLAGELEEIERDRRNSDPRPAAARRAAGAARVLLEARLGEVVGLIEGVEAEAAQFLVTFRFTALHGFEWSDLTGQSVPRQGVPQDEERGYNVDEVTRIAAARSGVRVGEDGEEVPVTAEQWTAVWDTIPAVEWGRVKLQIQILNEYSTFAARTQAVAAARKVSTARQAATRPSRSDSGSTLDASTGGNPPKSTNTSGRTAA